MPNTSTATTVFEDGNTRILHTEGLGYRLSCDGLHLEFGFSGGRLEVSALGFEDDMWKGAPLSVTNPLSWAQGEPSFQASGFPGGGRWIEAGWSRKGSFFKWIIEVHPNPLCVELRMVASRDWLAGVMENADERSLHGTDTAFAPIESRSPNARAVSGEDLLATVGITNRHVRLKGIHIHDITDYFDFIVEEKLLHSGQLGGPSFSGNLLECVDMASERGLLFARMAPTPEAQFLRRHETDFQWVNTCGVAVYGTGLLENAGPEPETLSSYSLVLLPGNSSDLRSRWRAHYRKRMQPVVFSYPLSLSNTWGDRNQDAALNQQFSLRELRALSQSGIRGLMLDDGWQAGVTANSKLQQGGVWEGYHAAESNFWAVHPEKFPDGLGPVVQAAKAVGKELALWFSPDSANDFANWEKDAAILLALFKEHAIRAFKLDGIKLRSRLGEARFGQFLDALAKGSAGRIVPVLDVTSEIRQGYFREIDHGILFLENRYTDWGNYYPFRTLRNVWQLTQWIPAQRLHIEFLNPRRNREKYTGDPFAPERYPISYLYAITLVGHPLAWMEVQHLHPDDRGQLKEVADWHASNHQRLLSADIEPIGDLPDGRSWSGFRFHFPDGEQGVLVFRDNAEKETFALHAGGDPVRQIGCAEATIRQLPGGNHELCLPQPRSWVYLGSY